MEYCHQCGRGQEQGEGWVRSEIRWHAPYSHEVCPEKVCKESVFESATSRPHPCSRNGKEQWEDGKWYCGIHIRSKKKHVALIERINADLARGNANLNRSKVACEILQELGVDAGPHYHHSWASSGSGYTGKVVVDPAELFRVLGIGFQLDPIQEKE